MLSKGDTLSGFIVEAVEEIPEYNAVGIFCIHKATGLEVFHVLNEDPENFFSFNFKTVPKNSKGTAHIVEHAVLSGSQNYPVKDPFQEIMKGSAQTFLNAMTYPDRTLYPGASPIRKDYFNLLKVYGDAVFFPLLRRETFQQEGIRISVKDNGSLQYQGIVFNEMKGAYSNHDSIVAEESIRQLFPDTPMHFDSGGDPRCIKDLTYEEFKGFHAENYHPSNCRVFFYGSISTEEQLVFLQKNFLSGFTAIRVDSDLPAPKPWKHPKSIHATSSANPEEDNPSRSSITINWLTRTTLDPVMIIAYEIITELLLGNPGAPMYQAIIDSEIGEDVAPLSGMEGDLREMVFSIGVRGTEPERAEDFDRLVVKTLRKLVKKGIPEEQLHAAIKKIEFQRKEIKGGIPQGLRCLVRILRGWMYGADPYASLQYLPAMETLKEQWREDRNYFSKIIKKDLLDNPHRLTVIVTPEAGHDERFEMPLKKSLKQMQTGLTKQGLASLAEQQENLEFFHDRLDDPAELDKIPRLKIGDLPEKIKTIDTCIERIGSVPLAVHQYHTNDICYVDYLFNTLGLDEEEQLLLPMFSRLIYTTGMPGISYAEVSSRLSELTGGFHSLLDISTPLQPKGGTPLENLVFRAKFLAEDMDRASGFIRDLLLSSILSDVRRIKDILVEGKNDFSISLLSSGNAFAALRSDARLSPVQHREDTWKGISQYQYLESIKSNDPEALRALGEKFERIRSKLLSKQRCILNITCPGHLVGVLKKRMEEFTGSLPEGGPVPGGTLKSAQFRKWEGLMTPSQVAYCAYSMPSSTPGSLEQLHQGILSYILSSDYLYEHVRLRGGAYGVGSSLNLLEGLITFMSYRDPHISRTINEFEKSLKSISDHGVSRDSLERALISVVSRDVRPMAPSEMGFLGLRRWIYGIDDQTRAERRVLTLETGIEDIQREARRLVDMFSLGCSAVLAGKEIFQREAADFPELLEHPTVLPS